MYPAWQPIPTPAKRQPSTSLCGSQRSMSRSMQVPGSLSSAFTNLAQGGLPRRRRRTPSARHRTDRRRLAGRKGVEQCLGRNSIEIFVEIVVYLEDRRVDAGTKTLHLDQRELSVPAGVARGDTELFLAGREDLFGSAQPT